MKSKQEFLKNAKPLTVVVNGVPLLANPMKFSTGSVGWNLPGKTVVELANGDVVEVQISANFTVRKSKELPDSVEAA